MNRRVLLLIIGALSFPLACGEPSGPAYETLAITTTSLPNASPNVAYSETLVATGGDSIYTWSVTVSSPPAGLSLAASTGVVSGTPTGASSTFTVQVASGDGQTDTQQLTIDVYDVLSVKTTSLPSGSTGVAYSEALVATGGDSNYTWSVTDGSLPTGLSLADSTGVISGTPSAEGSDTFAVQVVSGDGQAETQQLAIDVALVLQPSERCSDYPDYAIARFEDVNLEGAIRAALSAGAQEDLTCRLLAELMVLRDHFDGITSLVGIQNLTSLTYLDLSLNSINDISTLSGLTSLTYLDLSGNLLSDISALSGLMRLSGLWLGHNSISDVGALSGLTSLTSLSLGSNSISNISALSGLTSLQNLYLYSNSISDVGALSGLASLTYLDLGGNSISDVSALGGLTSLTYLALYGNLLSDLSPLSGLANLEDLRLHINSISDLSALSGLTSLEGLYLDYNSISDIGVLSGLTSLSVLSLGHNSISDVSALSGVTSLRFLYLENNSISDIGAMSGLTSLKVLWLFANPDLTNVQPLLDNVGLGDGDEVDLRFTSVSCADVAALRAKGVTVGSDCP